MYRLDLKNSNNNYNFPGFKFLGGRKESNLSVNFSNQKNLLVIKGHLSGKGYEKVISKALYDLEASQNRIVYLNVFINLSEIDNTGLISLFKVIEKLNSLSKQKKSITVYWNTNNDPGIYNIAREFEKVLNGQLFYASI